ncbi:MAG: hypothetical protein ACHRHE_06555 [Tepidisphaerales bacterium]
MSTAQLRDRAKEMIESLPPERLKVSASFLAYLGAPAGEKAEADLAVLTRMRQRIKTGEQDVAAGRAVDWRKVRSDV